MSLTLLWIFSNFLSPIIFKNYSGSPNSGGDDKTYPVLTLPVSEEFLTFLFVEFFRLCMLKLGEPIGGVLTNYGDFGKKLKNVEDGLILTNPFLLKGFFDRL